MTSNLNFNARWILQLVVIDLCVLSQSESKCGLVETVQDSGSLDREFEPR